MAGMPNSRKELPQSFGAIVKKPSALVPLVMSLAALADVVVSIAIFGVVHETDEGTAAHIWQLLMAGQMPSWHFSPSNGCRVPRDRRFMYSHCKPALRSQPWPPYSCYICNSCRPVLSA
jgi:hypothetical protein